MFILSGYLITNSYVSGIGGFGKIKDTYEKTKKKRFRFKGAHREAKFWDLPYGKVMPIVTSSDP